MKIKERYLINTLNPKYNDKLNNNNIFTFSIDVDWKLYSLDTETLIEKRNTTKSKFKNRLINYTLLENSSFLKIKTLKTNSYLHVCTDSLSDEIKTPFSPSMRYWGGQDALFLIKINNELYFHHLSTLNCYDNGISTDNEYGCINYSEYNNIDNYNEKHGENTFVIVESNEIDDSLFRDIDWQDCGTINYAPRKILFIKIVALENIFFEEKLLVTEEQISYLREIIKNINDYLPEKCEKINTIPTSYGIGDFYEKLQYKKDAQILLRFLSNYLKERNPNDQMLECKSVIEL